MASNPDSGYSTGSTRQRPKFSYSNLATAGSAARQTPTKSRALSSSGEPATTSTSGSIWTNHRSASQIPIPSSPADEDNFDDEPLHSALQGHGEQTPSPIFGRLPSTLHAPHSSGSQGSVSRTNRLVSGLVPSMEQMSIGRRLSQTTPHRPSPLGVNHEAARRSSMMGQQTALRNKDVMDSSENDALIDITEHGDAFGMPNDEQDVMRKSNGFDLSEITSSSQTQVPPDSAFQRSQKSQRAVATISPTTDDFSDQPKEPKSELLDLLQSSFCSNSGFSYLQRYSIKHIDLRTGKPRKDLTKLISEVVLPKIGPQSYLKINNSTLFSGSEWLLDGKTKSQLDTDNNTQHISGLVLQVNLVSAGNENSSSSRGQDRYRVTVGTKEDGKPERAFFKLGRSNWCSLRREASPSSGPISISDVIDACNSDNIDGIRIAIWFDHTTVELSDPAQILSNYKDTSQQSKAEIDLLLAHFCRTKLQDAGENGDRIVVHRNRAYSNQVSISLTLCGLVMRAGIQGKLVKSEGAPVRMYVSPCEHAFYRENQTVADFITAYLGQSKSLEIDLHSLEKLNKVLRGVKVKVAVYDGFNKMVCTVLGLGGSVVSIPQSLHGVRANISMTDLKFPKLPCVDVGRSGRPFYFPAELCLIQPDQLFFGKAPKVDRPDLFPVANKIINSTSADQRQGDPFAQVRQDEFKLLFIDMTHSKHAGVAHPLRPEIWDCFQFEVGQRFNKKLESAVAASQKLQWSFHDISAALRDISKIANGTNGPKTVAIFVVPSNFERNTIDGIKSYCERLIGFQHCFVNATELQRRYHYKNNKNMVMYTGQVVRKIFGRANFPGVANGGIGQPVHKPIAFQRPGRLFGIHMSRVYGPSDNNISIASTHHIITIVSISSGADIDICTTNEAITIDEHPTLLTDTVAHKIGSCLRRHMVETSQESTSFSAIYITGMPNASEKDMQALKSQTVRVVHKNAKEPASSRQIESTLIVVEPQNQIAVDLATGDSVLALTEVHSDNVPVLRHDYDLEDKVLKRIYRRPDGYRDGQGNLREPTETYHMTYQRSNQKIPIFKCLERRHLPDILHLAKAAGKRAQSNLYVDENSDLDTECPFKVADVHPALRKSLYYI